MRAVNLLPREPRLRRKRVSGYARLALVAPLVVAGLITAGYLLASSKVNERQATRDALRSELAALPAPRQQPQADPQLALLRDQRVAALGTALQSRLAWDRILREISAVLPGDVWLTTLSATGASPQPTPAPAPTTSTTTTSGSAAAAPVAAPTAGPLTFAGFTYSQPGVARLLSRLAVVPALQDVQLVSSTRTAYSGRFVFQFSIKANVRAGEIG
jgi:Tfp pilus assembly protein PilN